MCLPSLFLVFVYFDKDNLVTGRERGVRKSGKNSTLYAHDPEGPKIKVRYLSNVPSKDS